MVRPNNGQGLDGDLSENLEFGRHKNVLNPMYLKNPRNLLKAFDLVNHKSLTGKTTNKKKDTNKVRHCVDNKIGIN